METLLSSFIDAVCACVCVDISSMRLIEVAVLYQSEWVIRAAVTIVTILSSRSVIPLLQVVLYGCIQSFL